MGDKEEGLLSKVGGAKVSWDSWFIELAVTAAKKSKDRSIKVGCVVVGPDYEVRSIGYNGFPRGFDDNDDKWHARPMKYLVTAHAELNAVCNAARIGQSLKGCRTYVTLPPCSKCALALAQAGITDVRYLSPPGCGWETIEEWQKDFAVAKEIFRATGVNMRDLSRRR